MLRSLTAAAGLPYADAAQLRYFEGGAAAGAAGAPTSSSSSMAAVGGVATDKDLVAASAALAGSPGSPKRTGDGELRRWKKARQLGHTSRLFFHFAGCGQEKKSERASPPAPVKCENETSAAAAAAGVTPSQPLPPPPPPPGYDFATEREFVESPPHAGETAGNPSPVREGRKGGAVV